MTEEEEQDFFESIFSDQRPVAGRFTRSCLAAFVLSALIWAFVIWGIVQIVHALT